MTARPGADVRESGPADPITVHLDLSGRGDWTVELPGRGGRLTCHTLEDARRAAYLCAARRRRCELVVRDAYHRVLRHEYIEGDPAAAPPGRPPARG